MAQIHLHSNLRRVWNQPEFMALIQERDKYSQHPTNSSKYQFFCKKEAKVIYDSRAKMFYMTEEREEIAFITKVFLDPIAY
jgi:hypothetical protein